jgi:hypothetical protein
MKAIFYYMVVLQITAMAPSIAFGDMVTDGAAREDVRLWEEGLLPLVFENGISESNKALLFQACEHWSRFAKVKCVPGPYKKRELKVTSTKGQGCWATLGTKPMFVVISRRMNLDVECWNIPTLIHELGHSFGLTHEQQRSDRDDYVIINEENIGGGFLGLNTETNFARQDTKNFSEYDFLSIMHYHRKSHSKNGFDTIFPRPRFIQFIDVMGRAKDLSAGDIAAIQALYRPRRLD